jgi:hypothetical protein
MTAKSTPQQHFTNEVTIPAHYFLESSRRAIFPLPLKYGGGDLMPERLARQTSFTPTVEVREDRYAKTEFNNRLSV